MYISRTSKIIKWTYAAIGGLSSGTIMHYFGWAWYVIYLIVFVLTIKPLVKWRYNADNKLPRD